MGLKQKLDELIYDQIINSILLGEYKMGDQMHLDTLAEKYGVSRTPVVQAVKLLANNGILEILKNGRVRIPIFTPEQVLKICDVRLLLETHAIDCLFELTDSSSFQEKCTRLKKLAEIGYEQNSANDILSYNKSDLLFHTTLVECSDNEFLVTVYQQIQGRFVIANFLSNSWSSESISRSADAHKQIVQVIANKNKTLCKTLLVEHVESVSTHVINN